jgi:hypothetical protein
MPHFTDRLDDIEIALLRASDYSRADRIVHSRASVRRLRVGYYLGDRPAAWP